MSQFASVLALVYALAAGQAEPAAPPFFEARPPPTAQEIAAGKAKAEAILAASRASDVFENVTDGPWPRFRHRPSGFTCGVSNDPRSNVEVYASRPRGDDVVCNSAAGAGLQSLYFTRMPPGTTLDQAMGAVMQDVRRVHPDLQPAPGPFANATSKDPASPQRRTARFLFSLDGKRVFGRTSVVMIDGWMIQQRVSLPDTDEQAVARQDVQSELTMLLSLPQWVKEHR